MRLDRKIGHAYLLLDCLFTDLTKREKEWPHFKREHFYLFKQKLVSVRPPRFLHYNNNYNNNNIVLVNVLMSDCYSF